MSVGLAPTQMLELANLHMEDRERDARERAERMSARRPLRRHGTGRGRR
jgi:hypothetical protein